MMQLLRNRLVIMALVVGSATALLAYVFLARQASAATKSVQVVVAQHRVPVGTIMTLDMIALRSMRRNTVPSTAIQSLELVAGKVARGEITAGQIVTAEILAERSRLAQMIPPNMRAVTVSLMPVIGVGGFLKPGDHVDVIATFDINGGTLTRTILQNALLLATGTDMLVVDQDPARSSKPTKPEMQPTATLALLPTDAEKLILAESRGELRLVLRRSDDLSVATTRGFTGRAVIGTVPTDQPQGKPYESPAMNPAPQQSPTVTLTPAKLQPKLEVVIPAIPVPVQATTASKPPVTKSPIPDRKIQVIHGTAVEEVVVSGDKSGGELR